MKVLALAQHGVGGEKSNASDLLAKLLKRHGLTMADLDDAAQERTMVWIRYGDRAEEALLQQLIKRVLYERKPELWQRPTKSLRGRTKEIGVKATSSQRAELTVSWDVYRKAWHIATHDLINAFCLRNDLYGPSSDDEESDEPESTPEDRARMRRQTMMAMGLTPVDSPRRRLSPPAPAQPPRAGRGREEGRGE